MKFYPLMTPIEVGGRIYRTEADLQILPQMGLEICWDDPTGNKS